MHLGAHVKNVGPQIEVGFKMNGAVFLMHQGHRKVPKPGRGGVCLVFCLVPHRPAPGAERDKFRYVPGTILFFLVFVCVGGGDVL